MRPLADLFGGRLRRLVAVVIPATTEPHSESDRGPAQYYGSRADPWCRIPCCHSPLASGAWLRRGYRRRCRRNAPVEAYTVGAYIGSDGLTLIPRRTRVKCKVVVAGLQAGNVVHAATPRSARANHLPAGILYDYLYAR